MVIRYLTQFSLRKNLQFTCLTSYENDDMLYRVDKSTGMQAMRNEYWGFGELNDNFDCPFTFKVELTYENSTV